MGKNTWKTLQNLVNMIGNFLLKKKKTIEGRSPYFQNITYLASWIIFAYASFFNFYPAADESEN